MKSILDYIQRKDFTGLRYSLSISGTVLDELVEKYDLPKQLVLAEDERAYWYVFGYPETPVDVIRTIIEMNRRKKYYYASGITIDEFDRRNKFADELEERMQEAAETLKEATIELIPVKEEEVYDEDEYSDIEDCSIEYDSQDEESPEDWVEPEPKITREIVGRWIYKLHNGKNHTEWYDKSGICVYQSITDVAELKSIDLNTLWMIEYNGNVLKIPKEVIFPDKYNFLEKTGTNTYRFMPKFPESISITASDGLNITLHRLDETNFRCLFNTASLLADIAYANEVEASRAESHLFDGFSIYCREARLGAVVKSTALDYILDFFAFTQQVTDGFIVQSRIIADGMIRKGSGTLHRMRLYRLSHEHYGLPSRCPVCCSVVCRPYSDYDVNIEISLSAVPYEEWSRGEVLYFNNVG